MKVADYRAKALAQAARECFTAGQNERALALLERALRLCEEVRTDSFRLDALIGLAFVWTKGRNSPAR
jgi:hypothetical protein